MTSRVRWMAALVLAASACWTSAEAQTLTQVPAAQQTDASSLSAARRQQLLNAYLQSQSSGGAAAQAPPAAPTAAPTPGPAAVPNTVPNGQVLETQLSTTPVFGQSLFGGAFAVESFRGFNPDYLLSVGDLIDLRLWGAVDLEMQLAVDAQGNIFIPKVGPVHVINVPNERLNEIIGAAVQTVYRSEVNVYASLAAAVPVRVYVSGFVTRPGLYAGYSSDSVLNFLDRAGGIAPGSGSYLDVNLLRGGSRLQSINLYDFINRGYIAATQLHDGDSVFVGPLGPTVSVTGLVANPVQFEFQPPASIESILHMAGVNGRATNVRVIRNTGARREAFYVPLGDPLLRQPLAAGDEIEVTADRPIGNIAVMVEGEHQGSGQYVLPYDARLDDLLRRMRFTEQSDAGSLQLFRRSVAARQKEVLDQMLAKIEQSALVARSGTSEEASLRTQEAELMLKFVDRARLIVPKGQVVLPAGADLGQMALEDGDVIRVPRRTNLVEVHGEVFLPNAFVWRKGQDMDDYLRQAGGVIQESADDRILLMRPSGEVVLGPRSRFFGDAEVQPGDEILVLPAVDGKEFQFAKDITQVVYQIAIAAGVILRYD